MGIRTHSSVIVIMTSGALLALTLPSSALAGSEDDAAPPGLSGDEPLEWHGDETPPGDKAERDDRMAAPLSARQAEPERPRRRIGLHDGSILADPNPPALGIEGGYDLGPRWSATTLLQTSSQNLHDADGAQSTPLAATTSFHGRSDELRIGLRGVQTKLGTSVYGESDFGIRRARANWQASERLGGRSASGEVDTLSAILAVRVGAVWLPTRKTFVTLDLADLSLAFAGTPKAKVHAHGGISHELAPLEDDLVAASKKYGKEVAWQLFGVTAGMAF